jgi:hypothetical protein
MNVSSMYSLAPNLVVSVNIVSKHKRHSDRICRLVVRVPGYRSRGPDSITGATRFSELWVWDGVHSAS